MLVPYPDRLRSSRSSSSQSNANLTSTPSPPPPPIPSPSTAPTTPQHRFFPPRSNLPLARMRTNSLSSPSLSSSHPGSSSTPSDHPQRPLRNRPSLRARPSTSPDVPDAKHPSSPFSGSSPIPPFADFLPTRRRSAKRPPSRKESAPGTHSSRTTGTALVDSGKDARFSTADRAILKELKLGAAARESQFKIKGSKKHHAFPANEAPYPRNYERSVIDHDVWETAFIRQLCGSLTFHVVETPPTKVLDLGCGSGYWILECAKLWRNCEFVGLDLVPLHPDLSHLGSSDLASRIKWVQANCLEALPFPNEEFDFVHVKRIARGIPEDKWDSLLEEISRVMKPGAAIEVIEEDLFFPGESPYPPPLSQSSTPIPYITASPTSSYHLPNGPYYNASGFSQFGSAATISTKAEQSPLRPSTVGTSRSLTLQASIRNNDTVNLPGNSDLLYSDALRPAPGAPLNPRDHSLLEYIYTEMHAARFINLSPLSLLANSLPVYFSSVRSHAPIMFTFPPSDSVGVSRSTDERGVREATPSSAQPCRKDSSKITSATLIGRRQILNHTQKYVFLDESAVAPGMMTARQKASSSSSQLPSTACSVSTPTQHRFPSISMPISSETSPLPEGHTTSVASTAYSQAVDDDIDGATWLNTLPNRHLKFDLRSLNLHLSARVTEILACAEAMWGWVCEYQDSQRPHHGQQPHLHKEHSQSRNIRGEKGGANRFSAELMNMSRAEFDVLLTGFELDMRDCININSCISSAFQVPAPVLPPTNERKAFDKACEKWEEYRMKQRERSKARPSETSPREGTDSAAQLDEVEAADSTGQRLSRTFRVFCAWKPS
ncbi:hypothetical protein F5148DRAFT_976528 [Russula earlei]|uniref:Uncharacterized protein n=1 Tax=Russula earlei TaxID=71964 RepID=A0ACC0UGG2_9AGAM|nr:hypothetical protein F5148DRAFT_976528 [Russula earlei]